MKPAPAGDLLAFLAAIPDPRGRQGRRHPLEAMLASIVCAWLQGARGYVAIAQWIHDQDITLWRTLGFTRTPPTKGAFRNLLKDACRIRKGDAAQDHLDCRRNPLWRLSPPSL